MLPEMSGLQFLVVGLLFNGPRSGQELRRRMQAEGTKIEPSSFSRLMQRMEDANYLYAQTEKGPSGCRPVRPRQFEVTDLGVAVWRQVREFYAAMEGPVDDLVPIATDEVEFVHLPRKKRRALAQKRAHRQVKRTLERYFEKALGIKVTTSREAGGREKREEGGTLSTNHWNLKADN